MYIIQHAVRFLGKRVGGEKACGHYDGAKALKFATPKVPVHTQMQHSGKEKGWVRRMEMKDISCVVAYRLSVKPCCTLGHE